MSEYRAGPRIAKWHVMGCISILVMLLGGIAQGAEALLSEKLMPGDPIVALVLRDRAETTTRWKTTALFEVLQDPEMQAMVAPLKATLDNLYTKIKTVSPVPFEPLKQLMTGETGLSVTTVMGLRGPEPVIQLVAIPKDIPKAREELNKVLDAMVMAGLIEQQTDDGRTRTFLMKGEAALSTTCDEDAIILTVASRLGAEAHAKLLERKTVGQAGLSSDPEYAALRPKMDDDFEGWLYIGALPWIENNMGTENPAAGVLAMAGLADYSGIILGVRIEDRGFRTRAFAHKKAAPDAATPDVPLVTSPDLMKVPADVESFTVGSVDLAGLYDTIMPFLGMTPVGGEVMGFTARFQEITGLNLRDDVLAMLGKRFMAFLPEEGSPAGEGMAAFIHIDDRQIATERLAKALEGIVTLIREKAGPKTDAMVRIRTEDRGDFSQVYAQSVLPGMFTPNVTVTDEWVGLSFSARRGLPRTRYLLDKQKRSVLSRKDFTDVYAKVPTRCHFIHYEDVGANFGNLLAVAQLVSDIAVAGVKIAAMEGELPLPVNANELWGMDPGRFPNEDIFRKKLFGSAAIIAYQNDGTLFESFSPIGPLPVITRQWRNSGAQQQIATTSILAGMLLPALARARGEGRKAVCKENLSQIGKALFAYTMNNEEAYPATFEALMPEYINTPRVFRCPSAEGPGPHYAYIGGMPGNVAGRLPSNTIIACDFSGNHAGGRNVLFVDGAVRWMPEFMFQQELAQTKARVEAAFQAAEIPVLEATRAFLNDQIER